MGAANAFPEAIALSVGANALTFRELAGQSARLASYLIEQGASFDVPVALCLERSFDFIISALAVWLSGAAYLPLDPAWPAARLRKILKDAEAPLLISRGSFARSIPESDTEVIDLDSISSTLQNTSPLPAPVRVSRDNLAYVIYTSGSTGEPKGVEITHGNLLNLIFWHRRTFGISTTDRASHVAGVGFDAAVWEIWPHLTSGATLVLVDSETRTSADLLRDWLVDNRITVAFVPTILAEPMLDHPWPRETALRYLLTGGESLHRYPTPGLPFTVVNNYGPTECTVVATSAVLAPRDQAPPSPPSIGKAIAHTVVRIFDEHGRPVAPGQAGEIYISGAGVARGYRSNPTATAERFPLDCANPNSSARMYRTGDLGCVLPDGQIAFRGRLDSQEQINGHRVEPDEIVCALNRHPAVAASAVVARSQGGSNSCGRGSVKILVAYVVPRDSMSVTASGLREFLSSALPHYMVPSTFVRIAALPLNANGKLDRLALADPTPDNCIGDADYRPPATPTEEALAEILANLLHVERVGANDNFFLLGLHSLLATQVGLRVYERFGIQLGLRHLFEAQTVARLAQELDRQLEEKLNSMSEQEIARYLSR